MGGDFYWVKEKHVFTRLEEAPAVLDSLGYSLNCEEEKEKVKKGSDFAFLTLKEDNLVSYDALPNEDVDIPF